MKAIGAKIKPNSCWKEMLNNSSNTWLNPAIKVMNPMSMAPTIMATLNP